MVTVFPPGKVILNSYLKAPATLPQVKVTESSILGLGGDMVSDRQIGAGVGEGEGVGLGVLVGVGLAVGVLLGVGVGVLVGVGVGLGVGTDVLHRQFIIPLVPSEAN